jgi:copper chaperone CopZ
MNQRKNAVMKAMLLIVAIAISITTNAQVTKVSLRASGLTCSMCSNAINKALRTLDYVIDVDADIKTYTFEIAFKPNVHVDFDLIRKKVENAGFTVSDFIAIIDFDKVHPIKNDSVTVDEKTFLIENVKQESLNGIKRLRILDKGFVSPGEYKTNVLPVLPQHTYHATI